MGTPLIEATSPWQAMMTWMGLIVTPEQTDALCHRSRWEQNTVEGGHYMDLQKLQGTAGDLSAAHVMPLFGSENSSLTLIMTCSTRQ